MNASIPHPAGLFSGRMMARTQLGSWATHDPMAKPVRLVRPSLVLTGMRNLVVSVALAVIFTVCMRVPLAAPADAAVFPPEPPLPVAVPLPTATPASVPPAMSAPAAPDPVAQPLVQPTAQQLPKPVPPSLEPVAGATPVVAVTPAETTPASEEDGPRTTGIRVLTTGYCPCQICCGPGAEGITSIRRDVHRHPRGIAVDPTLIPYRTVLTVPGYGTAMADDTGAAMRHDGDAGVVHIDLRFRTHSQAKAWGVRWLDVDVPEASLAATLAKPASEPPPGAAMFVSAEHN